MSEELDDLDADEELLREIESKQLVTNKSIWTLFSENIARFV